MSRKRLRSAVSARGFSRRLLIVAALVAVLVGIARVSGGASSNQAGVVSHPSAGIVRSGSSATAGGSGTGTASATSFGPNVGNGIYDGESPAVSDLPVLPVPAPTSIIARDNENLHPSAFASTAKDPIVQKTKGTGPISDPIANFDGICLPFGPPCDQASSCSCLPPDTNGEVGATQYVQIVNSDFAVYSKAGTVLRGATPINQLWAGTNSECATHNEGDPVVVYDQLAKRWLISEFIASPNAGEQYGECIAVSKTGDALGGYYLYTFLFGSDTFYDYPKIGVWPDGYYMTANEFPTGQETSSGAGAFVFERSQMLQGLPARYVFFDEAAHNPPPPAQYIGQLPGDLDGSALPPAGQPNLFGEVDDPSTIPTDAGSYMRFWKFHVDWANPANSTFGINGDPNYKLPVAAFVRPQCVYGYGPNCVVQKGGPQGLDVLGGRLMFRMPIRSYGKYESVALNHTVVVTAPTGFAGTRSAFRKVAARASTSRGRTRRPTRRRTRSTAGWAASRWTRRRSRAWLQRLGPQRLSIRALHGPRSGGSSRPTLTGGEGRLHGHGSADRGRGPLGRLQRPDGRPHERLHFLLHDRVPGRGHGRDWNLADARRLVQVPRLQVEID
jgi:hypothetical protein